MKEILEEYENNGAIKSKLANIIWESGEFVSAIIYCVNVFYGKQNYLRFLYYLGIVVILYIISQFMFIRKAAKELDIEYRIKHACSLKYIRKIYREIDIYQKRWITDFCNKNKINSFNKLSVLREEIRDKKEKSTIQYINPIIIGTLSLTIWEIGLQKVVDKVGFWNMIPLAFMIAISTSVLIGGITKVLLEDKDVFIEFEKFSNKKRLEELILYRILKSKK